jgi:hypothetical protein
LPLPVVVEEPVVGLVETVDLLVAQPVLPEAMDRALVVLLELHLLVVQVVFHLELQLPTEPLEPLDRVAQVDQQQHLVQLLPVVEAVEADTSVVAVVELTPIRLELMVVVAVVVLVMRTARS